MPVKPYIFSGNQCIDDIRRDVFILSPCAVLNVEFTKQDVVFGVDLCGKVAGRVLQLLKLGERTKLLCRDKNKQG
jgi:hypothetical protein